MISLRSGVGRIVVDVKHVHRCAVDEPQAVVVAAAFVQVIGVGQDAGPRMGRVDRHVRHVAQFAQHPRKSPQLQLRHDAVLFAQLQQRPIALGHRRQVELVLLAKRRPAARPGDRPPICGGQVHDPPGFFQALGAPRVVVDDPLGKPDHALDRQAQVGDPLAQLSERSAGPATYWSISDTQGSMP